MQNDLVPIKVWKSKRGDRLDVRAGLSKFVIADLSKPRSTPVIYTSVEAIARKLKSEILPQADLWARKLREAKHPTTGMSKAAAR